MSRNTRAGRIAVQIADGVADVRIDNPTMRNALTKSMCIELQQLMPALEAAQDVAVVTLRGAGDMFSAGASIGELTSVLLDPQEDGTLADHLSLADQAITSLSKPTVALVDGACMGGGWQIAAACDFIVASERSVFAITPAKIGIIYPRAGIERLVRLVGPATAKHLLFTGRVFAAAEARSLGLVAEVVADDEFGARAHALTAALQERSLLSIHLLKSLVDQTAADDPRLDDEWTRAWQATTSGPDMAIGVNAFMNREQPRFTWRPT